MLPYYEPHNINEEEYNKTDVPLQASQPDDQPKEKDWKGIGCGMLILILVSIPVLIIVAIVWDYPGENVLGYMLWFMAKIPWMLGIILAPAGLSIYAFERGGADGCNTPVTAEIVEIIEESHANTNVPGTYKTFTPVYSYVINSQTVKVKGRGYSTSSDKYQVGQQVQMLVSPGEPDKYDIKSETAKAKLVGGIMGWGGLVILLLGLGMWVLSLLIFILE